MTARKAQLAGLAAILALSTTGCGIVTADDGDTPTAATTSSAPAEPRDVLLDAIPGDQASAYHFDVKGSEVPMSGVLDASKKAVEIKVVQTEPDAGFTLAMTTRMIGEKTWVKFVIKPANMPGLPKIPKNWQLLDPAKLQDKSIVGYDGSTDPGYVWALVNDAAAVKQTSPGHFTGSADLTKTTQAEIVEEKTLTAMGAKAKAVPFEAVVDAGGHLTSFVAKIPAAGGHKATTYSVKYSGYGKTATPAAPAAGEQQKATSVIYEMLRG
jgi:hypothetical protein